MAEERIASVRPSVINLVNENLFELRCLIRATSLSHSARCEIGRKQLLAFATSQRDLGLCYQDDIHRPPTVRRIPWFRAPQRAICALCFDPSGTWLLVASIDGSLYIVPALALVDNSTSIDHRWTPNDLTCFTSLNLQSSYSRPTCLTWWHGVTQCSQIGVIGTERGEIVFVNLENGQQVGLTRVTGNISSLHVCQDNSLETVSLLITNQSRQQWRLILEQRTNNYVYPLFVERSNAATQSYAITTNAECYGDEAKNFPPARSRLQGLKQLSVEKLAVLRQKLAETRNRNLTGNTPRYESGSSSGTEETNTPEHTKRQQFDDKVDAAIPELLSSDMYLFPQYTRQGQHLYTGYSDATHHVTIHGTDISVSPLHMYKMPGPCKDILLTQRLFFVVGPNRRSLCIISCPLSETRIGEETDFNNESLMARFDLENANEVIRDVYRATDYKKSTNDESPKNVDNKYSLPSKVEDLKVDVPLVDTCIVVTNIAVYKVVLRNPLLNVFMDFVVKRNDLERAGRLGVVFGMNVQQLLESAGDIFLMNNDCARAVVLYKLSRCRLLKRVLKFAAAGRTAKLLGWLMHCLAPPTVNELTTATRLHLSNLSVLAFTELTLRATAPELNNMNKDFLSFLSTNIFYDELWAIDIAGQTCLWKVLHHLATQRGLFPQVLDILVKAVQSLNSGVSCFMSSQNKYGLLICISEPNLVQAILSNPYVARSHMAFVLASLSSLPIFVLQRLVTLYDPTNPALRPLLVRCRARRRTMSQSSQSSQCDSLDSADVLEDAGSLVEEVVETFLMILSTLIHKKTPIVRHDPSLMRRTQLPGVEKRCSETTTTADFKRRLLSAGYAHVALIRNGNVYTWGNSAHGCLGTGPSVSRFGSPNGICLFRNMEMEVLSVSCGRSHTLAVTNNGVYAWGASQFGQLGLGKILQCPNPELVTSLAQEIIVDAVAGQYHSVALTIDGRLFTWGWGVHGQLGHGDTDEKNIPTLVTSLLGVVVRHISAGHAHTLTLSTDGYVYVFGCNIFGQLGTGSGFKSSLPVKVSLLPEKITHISTGYFHNLAVSHTNKLYTWGASPQVLRLQTQAQKKSKILEYQAAAEKFAEAEIESQKSSEKADDVGTGDDATRRSEDGRRPNNDVSPTIDPISGKIQKRLADNKTLKGPSLRDLNIGILEESQTHMRPIVVDTSLVNGRIVQISTGCHHSALLTKDGTVYTWGRNLDGQIGNGTRREVLIPTPVDYNPASVLAQIPTRSNNAKTDGTEFSENSGNPDNNDGMSGNLGTAGSANTNSRRDKGINRMIKTVRVCCGCDVTVAIQPGGTVLAWGSNSMAQLGRPPTKDSGTDEKLVLLKSSKRIVRLPHGTHVAHDTPSQVPYIPTPIISYQSYDVTPLAGRVRPLSVVEKSPSELTLHYVLEQFHGFYDNGKIMDKFIENGDYRACSKLALLEQNLSKSFAYQLKTLNPSTYDSLARFSEPNESTSNIAIESPTTEFTRNSDATVQTVAEIQHVKDNTELFDEQVVRNLVDSIEECATKKKIKMPTSRSLDSFETIDQELHTFDCQGGSEGLCEDTKSEDISLDLTEDALDNEPDETDNNVSEYNRNNDRGRDVSIEENSNERVETSIDNETDDASTMTRQITSNLRSVVASEKFNDRRSRQRRHNAILRTNDDDAEENVAGDTIADATGVIKFYMNEIDDGAHAIMREVLHTVLEFWIEHKLPMAALEKVLLEHINKLFYPLGLLLFCQSSDGENVDANKNSAEIKSLRMMNSLSTRFCLQVCSMLLQHVDQGKPTLEYIELFSLLTAKNYGPPLTGYPGSSENRTAEQMMEGIISTLSSKACDPRPFIHIKDPERVSSFLDSDEDTVVFTCGHHFPISIYNSEVIPNMEAELLMSQQLPLPCTAQLLGNMLNNVCKAETLCPMCIPRALQSAVDNITDR